MTSPEPRLLVLVALPGTLLLDLAGPLDVFTTAHALRPLDTAAPAPGYEVLVAAPGPAKQVRTNLGVELTCPISVLDIQRPIDTLLLLCSSPTESAEVHAPFYAWLRQVAPHVRRIGSVCVGAFALARSGLLDGKKVTTHWEFCDRLQASFPALRVMPSPFYVQDGKFYTSGGVSSGLDLALALVEEDHGRKLAGQVARKLVLYLKRPGNQLQFGAVLPGFALTHPLVAQLRPWLQAHLADELSVDRLAEQLHMSERNFARVFTKSVGITPAKFIEKLRVEVAQRYLEDTNLTLDTIAQKCGFKVATTLHRVFQRHLAVTPGDYRAAFQTTLTATDAGPNWRHNVAPAT